MRLRWFLGVIVTLIIGFTFIKKYPLQSINITIFYDKQIDNLPIHQLKNLRYLNESEKNELFKQLHIASIFSINKAIAKIQSIQDPQIILWFTNHFGQVPTKGLEWYVQNIFSHLAHKSAILWLIDLAAWRYLSLDEKQVEKFVDFVTSRCPLCYDQSPLFPRSIENFKHIQFLRASDFFNWLASTPITVSPPVNNIVRNDLRRGAARFSLRQLGFEAPFLLNNKKDETPLLDLDHSQIFPLLQYLEALYYTLCIAKWHTRYGKRQCNIVFLLPNKEFAYYLVIGERKPFETFKNNLCELLKQNKITKMPISIYFYPFAYGNNFYDQPFEELGDNASIDEISQLLKNNFKNEELT